jgi:hypothetical protein
MVLKERRADGRDKTYRHASAALLFKDAKLELIISQMIVLEIFYIFWFLT